MTKANRSLWMDAPVSKVDGHNESSKNAAETRRLFLLAYWDKAVKASPQSS